MKIEKAELMLHAIGWVATKYTGLSPRDTVIRARELASEVAKNMPELEVIPFHPPLKNEKTQKTA